MSRALLAVFRFTYKRIIQECWTLDSVLSILGFWSHLDSLHRPLSGRVLVREHHLFQNAPSEMY